MIHLLPQLLEKNFSGTITNLVEIGPRDGDDAVKMAQMFNVHPANITIFEPHPDLSRNIRLTKSPDITLVQKACSNKRGVLPFYSCIIGSVNNLGVSSLVHRPEYDDPSQYKRVDVDVIRMDDWMSENAVDRIDLLKLDVEGHTWEVLDGFGDRLKDVVVIHLEAERKQYWDGQKMFSDIIKQMLPTHELVFCYDSGGQSDSIWIEKRHTKCT